jgi:integrase
LHKFFSHIFGSGRVSRYFIHQTNLQQILQYAFYDLGRVGRSRSLYSLRHTYATFALRDGRDIHKLELQMGTSVKMLEQFYSKLSPRMNAAEHAGIRPKKG